MSELNVSMNTREARVALVRALKYNRNMLLVGKPGVGKTSIVNLVAKDLSYNLVVSSPATSDPSDSKGLGYPSEDHTHANFLPFGEIYQLLRATLPTIWFIDDIGQASPQVQAAYMPWILARRNGDHVLPDCVHIISATNSRAHKAGVSGILEPVKSRFHSIVQIESNYKIWKEDFAVVKGMPSVVLAYLDWSVSHKNTDFNKFVPTNDIANTPCERTWANAGDLINDYFDLDIGTSELFDANSILFKSVSGAIGFDETSKFWTFLKLQNELVESISYIIDNPETAQIPKSIEPQFLVINSLISSASNSTIPNIAKYAHRFFKEANGELAVSMINDIFTIKPELKDTPTFVKLMTSKEFGQAFAGSKH